METTLPEDPHVGNVYCAECPCRGILDLIASKWSTLIIGRLEEGAMRFGELRRAIPGVTQKMLTQTLRKLEENGLVDRAVHPTRPPKVEYSLTEVGVSVTSPLAAVRSWAEAHLGVIEQARERYQERVATES